MWCESPSPHQRLPSEQAFGFFTQVPLSIGLALSLAGIRKSPVTSGSTRLLAPARRHSLELAARPFGGYNFISSEQVSHGGGKFPILAGTSLSCTTRKEGSFAGSITADAWAPIWSRPQGMISHKRPPGGSQRASQFKLILLSIVSTAFPEQLRVRKFVGNP